MRLLKLLLLLTLAPMAMADNYDGTLDVFESSPELKPFFDNAWGYAVFPAVGKGGIGIGGAYGKGRVYEQGRVVGHVKLRKVSVGLQLGGQAFSEIVFLQDKRAFDEFTSGRYEFDASASAIVVTASAQARAGTDGASASTGTGPAITNQVEYGYNKGMAVFIHPLGGLMYEASIGGQKFSFKPIDAKADD
jgi:lipid-binding SYLF domain-containing protein